LTRSLDPWQCGCSDTRYPKSRYCVRLLALSARAVITHSGKHREADPHATVADDTSFPYGYSRIELSSVCHDT
jgi:hypothetical protein